jgi:hypothetical protein
MQNFWSIIWIVVWSFLFIAYLMIFFRIITDLFSDHEVSGWIKAIWIIALIFVPFLTALIYLIARGKGMAERQMGRMREMQSQQDAYIRDVAAKSGGSKSAADSIADAKALLDNGTITAAEFDQLKAKALASA